LSGLLPLHLGHQSLSDTESEVSAGGGGGGGGPAGPVSSESGGPSGAA